jgi:hypothetical protein
LLTGNTSAELKNKTKFMSGIPIIGVHRTVVNVALLQYLQGPRQLSLKYYQVVAQVAHQVATMITVVGVKVAIMA